MTRHLLIAILIAGSTSILTSSRAHAQKFIPQTKSIPGVRDYTHADAMKVLGPPARHRGNQGLPNRDTTRTRGRWDTIYERGKNANQIRNYQPQGRYQQPKYYNYQYNNHQYNVEQFRQGVQELRNAIQQIRQQRMQYQYRYQQPMYQQNGYYYYR